MTVCPSPRTRPRWSDRAGPRPGASPNVSHPNHLTWCAGCGDNTATERNDRKVVARAALRRAHGHCIGKHGPDGGDTPRGPRQRPEADHHRDVTAQQDRKVRAKPKETRITRQTAATEHSVRLVPVMTTEAQKGRSQDAVAMPVPVDGPQAQVANDTHGIIQPTGCKGGPLHTCRQGR